MTETEKKILDATFQRMLKNPSALEKYQYLARGESDASELARLELSLFRERMNSDLLHQARAMFWEQRAALKRMHDFMDRSDMHRAVCTAYWDEWEKEFSECSS